MPSLSPRRRGLTFLVIGALVVPAVLLSILALSLLRELESLGHRSIVEYGFYLAELSIGHVEQALWDDEQRLMVATRADPPRGSEEVTALLARLKENPFYRLVFWVRPDRTIIFPTAVSWEDRTSAAILRVLDPVEEGLRTEGQGPAPLHHIAGEEGGRPFQVTFFTLRSWEDEVLGAVVLVWDLEYVERSVLPQLLAGGPPQGKTVFRAGHLREDTGLSVIARDGRIVFESGPEHSAPFVASLPFRRVLPFYRLAVRLEDAQFRAWMRTVRTTHLALIGAMLLVVLLGGVFLIRWIHREIELADLKSHLVSSVSHELKTPIALIRLYAETLEMGRVTDPVRMREFLQVISRETQRLTHLINNALDMSQIDAGRKTYRFAPSDLADIVRQTLEAYRYQLDQQGFRLVRDLDPGPLTVELDEEAMTQAFINLLDNAVKYSNGAEQKTIEVTLRRQGNRALLGVRDHGIGIPVGEEERIFDLFYRVNDTRVQGVKGSGLGLTLVRHIVVAHGGRVMARSRPGEGSTFVVDLPLADADLARRREA
jgi:signal transduction histidine kinase